MKKVLKTALDEDLTEHLGYGAARAYGLDERA